MPSSPVSIPIARNSKSKGVPKNEESFETYKAIKELAKLEEELKNRKKGKIK